MRLLLLYIIGVVCGDFALAATPKPKSFDLTVTPGNAFAKTTAPALTLTAGTYLLKFEGLATDGDSSVLLDKVADGTSFAAFNGGFETPLQKAGSEGYTYRPTGSGWTFENGSGIQRNGSAWLGPVAPQGLQTAFIQNQGSLSRALAMKAGTHTFSFYAAQRGNWNTGTQSLRVTFNSTTQPPPTPSPGPTATPSPIPTPTPSPTPTSETVTLQWNANPEPDIAGYRLHYGKASGVYMQVKETGKVTSVPVTVDAGRWYFSITAFNTASEESAPSAEVAYP